MITLNLTEEELKLIGAALGELPYRAVVQIVANITKQVSDQNHQENDAS